MKLISNRLFLEHDTGSHPENKSRLESFPDLEQTNIITGLPFITLIHPERYIKVIEEACMCGDMIDQDTITSPGSFQAAVHAAGAAVMASQYNDFALVRPPGHHAYRNKPGGFCLFNNIAVAVQRLVNEGKRVCIIDIDGHYGNGTSDIFYDSSKVLFCSLHQYPAFPGNGTVNEIGNGEGCGYNINVPLPPGSGDDLFMDGCEMILAIAKLFKPDAVAVSAGFDGHHADPLLNLRLSANSFHWIGSRLRENFKNIFATLEGGYNTNYLDKCVYNFINGINGSAPHFSEPILASDKRATTEYMHRIKSLNKIMAGYW